MTFFEPLALAKRLLLFWLQPESAPLAAALWQHFQHCLPLALAPGLYAVLEHETTLELLDAQGAVALYGKRQKVRFLQNNIIAYQDKAWGDGDIFAEYRCAPGVPVDRYREGHYYRVLIALRQTKRRGEVEEFHIARKIHKGFTRAVEDLQTEIDHRTQQLTIHVIFPPERVPTALAWIEQKRARTTLIGSEQLQKLPDGRRQVTWQVQRPRLFEAYLLRWEW